MTGGSHRLIAYYCVATHLGGAERSMLDLITRVEAHSLGWYRPWVIVPMAEGPLVDALIERDIPFSVLPMPRGFFGLSRSRPLRSLLVGLLSWPAVSGYVRRLRALLDERKPALVHSNGIKCHLLAARLGNDVPVLWHLRDIMTGGATRSMLRQAASRPNVHRIANSYATALAFDSATENPVVVYNGIDTDRFVPTDSARCGDRCRARYRDRFGVTADVPIVGIVGVLQRGKGIDHFIQMAAILRADGIDARYVVVGDAIYDTGRDRDLRVELEAQVEKLGLGDVLHFTGFEDDPVEVMQGLDMLVSASTHPESFGRVVVEAMACGVSVAASALGGVLEVIEDHYCGRLFPPGDAAAMARAVGGLLMDKELRAECIARGRERAVERFSIRSHVAGVVRTYDRVLHGDPVKLG